MEEVDLPEKADCIVSEWLGVFALQENMLPSVALARDRLLKPGGRMLPETIGLFVALVEDEELHERKIGRWLGRPYGLNYADFAHCQANDVHAVAIDHGKLLSDAVQVTRLDIRRARDSRLRLDSALRAARDGACHGLCGWFTAEFPGGIALDTAPGRPVTHWNQAFFPILEPVALRSGEEVAVRLSTEPEGALVHFAWEIVVTGSGRPPVAGDTRRAAFHGR